MTLTKMKTIGHVFKNALDGWLDHKAARMGGALAYYTVFSIGPLLLIATAVAGAVFGQDAAQNEVFQTLRGWIGDAGAEVAQQAVKGASKPSTSIIATVVGIVTLMFGATGVFGELHDALNTVWAVHMKPGTSVKSFLRERFLSITMVFGTAFLLLVSLIVTTVLSFVGAWLGSVLPGGEVVWQILNFLISFGIIMFLFAGIFMYVPDVHCRLADRASATVTEQTAKPDLNNASPPTPQAARP